MNAVPEKKTPVTRKKVAAADPVKATEDQSDTLREEMEAKIREEMAAEIRAEMEAKIRAEVTAEADEEARVRAIASEARPISGFDIAGRADKEGSLVVHFVEDGFTILGKVWFRGEELPINPGTPQWDEAYPVLSLSEYEQEERWGRRFFREGPWRGKRLDEIDDENLTEAERVQLKKAEQARRERLGITV